MPFASSCPRCTEPRAREAAKVAAEKAYAAKVAAEKAEAAKVAAAKAAAEKAEADKKAPPEKTTSKVLSVVTKPLTGLAKVVGKTLGVIFD